MKTDVNITLIEKYLKGLLNEDEAKDLISWWKRDQENMLTFQSQAENFHIPYGSLLPSDSILWVNSLYKIHPSIVANVLYAI